MSRMTPHLVLACVCAAVLAAAPFPAMSQEANHVLKAYTFGAAGARGASANFSGDGTLGQAAPPGVGMNPAGNLHAGFWRLRAFLLRPTGVDELPPLVHELRTNFPNPFNPSTTIMYAVASPSLVRLEVYDLAGKLTQVLVRESQATGVYRTVWDGRDRHGRRAASGLYVCRLEIDGFTAVRKMLLLK